MATDPRHALSRLVGGLALVLLVGLALAWVAPVVARLVVHTQRGGRAERAATDPAEVDALVARAIAAAGLDRRLAHEEVDGVRRETWQLPPGRRAEQVAEELRTAARSAGVELHVVSRDLLDAQVRVYAGPDLRQELFLIPALPADSPPPPAPNRRERPLLALVVGGLGEQAATSLVKSPVPLTVAVRPWAPHSLPTARDAALAWQEVLVDLPARGADPAQARAAIPNASGFLVREGELAPLAGLDHPGVVVTSPRLLPGAPAGLLVLGAWQARDRALGDLLARLRYLAATDGHSTLLVEHDAPVLPELLRWLGEQAAERYRVVLASEIARPEDTIGLLDTDNPRAAAGP